MKIIIKCCLLGIILNLSGCFEIEEECTLNPDGSGKLRFSYIVPAVSLLESYDSLDDMAKNYIEKTLLDSSGVDAWTDVTYEVLEYEKIKIDATVYFKDYNKLGIKPGKFSVSKTDFSVETTGERISIKEVEKNEHAVIEPIAGEALEQKVNEVYAQSQQLLPEMEVLLADYYVKQTFILPGKLDRVVNFSLDRDKIYAVIEGAKVVDLFQQTMGNKEWLRANLHTFSESNNFLEELSSKVFNEMIYGEAALLEASATNLKQAFDYEAEVQMARNHFAVMLEELGIKDSMPIVDKTGNGVAVAHAEVYKLEWIRKKIDGYGNEPGITFGVFVELNQPVLNLTGGNLKALVDLNGEDILPGESFDREIHFVNLYDNGRTATFNFDVEGLERAGLQSAFITFVASQAGSLATETVDMSSFGTGSKSDGGSMKLEIAEQGFHYDNRSTLEIEFPLAYETVKHVYFYDAAGKSLPVEQVGSSYSSNKTCHIRYAFPDTVPDSGKIEVEYYTDIKRFFVDVELSDVVF